MWTAAIAVCVGTVVAGRGIDDRLGLICAAAGAICVVSRRRPVIAIAGLFVLLAALAALRPLAATGPTYRPPAPPSGRFAASMEVAFAGAPDRPAALIAGLTIGDTSGIDSVTTEGFRRTGLAHLVAVSGSNVAIVLAAVALVTVRLPLMFRCVVGAAVLALYVGVVGPEPSVLRAAAMGLVGLLAYMAGRRAMPLNALGIAVTAVVAAKPELLFSIGLHLSVAATLGIVVFSQPLDEALHRLPGLLRAPVAITLAAQIAVAPLLIGVFGQLPLVGPLANVLAAPAVPPATVLGLSAGVMGLVWPEAAGVLASLTVPFARWILWVGDTTAAWSWASVDIPGWIGWVVGVPIGIGAAVAAARG